MGHCNSERSACMQSWDIYWH